MGRHEIIGVGATAALALAVSGCGRSGDLDPPTIVQLTCTFDTVPAPMVVVIDTGLETASWVNLPEPRSGASRVLEHQYQLHFPVQDAMPAVRVRVNRYDATVVRVIGTERSADQRTGGCVKDKAGPRL